MKSSFESIYYGKADAIISAFSSLKRPDMQQVPKHSLQTTTMAASKFFIKRFRFCREVERVETKYFVSAQWHDVFKNI